MAATNYYVTTTGAGAKDGLTWATAMSLAEMETDIETNGEPGDNYFIMEGSYTQANAWDTSAKAGTTLLPISIIGVKAGTTADPPTSVDWADGTARPTITTGANQFVCGAYYIFRNLIYTGTPDTGVLRLASVNMFSNCKITNTSSTANREAAYLSSGLCRMINCEVSSTAGQALAVGTFYLVGCKITSAGVDGLYSTGNNNVILFCQIQGCTGIGLNIVGDYSMIYGNTFYNCGTAIKIGAGEYGQLAMNNLIVNCTKGIEQATANQLANHYDYNFYNTVTTALTLVTEGPNSDETAADPQFTDAAGGNFGIGTNLKALGFPGAFPGGLSTGYLDPGAVQRQESSSSRKVLFCSNG